MLIPYNTDAPIYHLPFTTVGLIVVNVIVYFLTTAQITDYESLDEINGLILEFDKIHPGQWLTNNFMHAGFGHLAGNMFFLWGFGLLVEGKLGWWRFLSIYLGMGVLYGAFVQTLMFVVSSGEGGALGASGVIFGVLALALAWAPRNEMNCVLIVGIYPRPIDITVLAFAGFYMALQVLFYSIGGFQMSSAALHLTGFAIGMPLGLLMVQRDWVDCEGWDLINVWRGREHEAAQEARARQKREENTEPSPARQRAMVLQTIDQALTDGHHVAATAIFAKHVGLLGQGAQLNDRQLRKLVEAMHQQKHWHDSLPLMVQLLQRGLDSTGRIRLTLAQILIQVENRPQQAIAVLRKTPMDLDEKLTQRKQKLLAAAQQMVDAGNVELDLEDW